MAHGKDPALPLYALEWRTDLHVRMLERGLRALLLDLWSLSWTEGALPDSPEGLAEVVDGTADEVRDLLSRFFELQEDGWISPRMEAERAERIALREKRAAAGRKGRKSDEDSGDKSGDDREPRRERRRNKRQANGEQTGNKSEANGEQTASKPETKPEPSASASASLSPLTPRGAGESSAKPSVSPNEPDNPPELDAEHDAITEMLPICRDLGVKAGKLPLSRRLRGFYGDGGTLDALRILCRCARTGSEPGGLLWEWLGDVHKWKAVLADYYARAKHSKALKRSREAATEDEFREVNGLGPPGSGGLRLMAGGAA